MSGDDPQPLRRQVKHQAIATAARRPSYDELATALPKQPHFNGDDSPTKEGTTKSCLWMFVAKTFMVFPLRTTRPATVLEDFPGTQSPSNGGNHTR